jgi:hypothetical protein
MLDVIWLPAEKSRQFVYFEEHQAAAIEPPPAEAGGGRLHRLRLLLERNYRKLESHFPISERLCSQLRFHNRVKLLVPDGLPEEEARRMFLSFLRKCVKSHGVWFLIDCFLALVGAALVWVPGPNVFFFYPALRAWAHYHAQSGGKSHQGGSGIEIQHYALLAGFLSLSRAERIRRAEQIERDLGFTRFAVFVEKRYAAE